MLKSNLTAWNPADIEGDDLPLLAAHIDLLLSARGEILSRPELCFCTPRGCGIGILYAGPNGPLPLGLLLTMWSRGEWLDPCDRCAGSLYVTYVAGTPLSGRGTRCGFCADCAVDPTCETPRQSTSIATGLGRFLRPVMELRDTFDNPLIPQAAAPEWRWDRPPESTNDIVPELEERVWDGVGLEVVVARYEKRR